MSVTLLDIILIGITLVSALLAMVRGFSREILSIASWVIAAVLTLMFYKSAIPLVQPYVASTTIASIIAAVSIFIVALIVVSLITMKIADMIIDSRIGALDRALGFVFGAVRGVLLVVVAMLFFNWLVADNQPTWVANARTKPLLDNLGERLVAAMPENPQEEIMRRVRPDETSDGAANSEGGAPQAN